MRNIRLGSNNGLINSVVKKVEDKKVEEIEVKQLYKVKKISNLILGCQNDEL